MMYRTVKGQTLDIIAWRHYGDIPGSFESILEANPGLAAYGPILPSGLVIILPDMTEPSSTESVSLWD